MELPLGDLVSFASGNTPSKSNPEFWGGDTPWISANAMHSPFLSDSELRLTKIAVLEKAKLCAEGDILLLVRGSGLHSRLPVGVAEIPLAFNQDVKAIRSVDDRLDQQYLFYWFRGNQEFLLESVEYTGIGAGKLDTDFLKKITLNLPCLSEQHSIAHIGRCLDRKIELNQTMNQTLEEIAKAIFKSWFVDFDPVRAKVEGRPTGLPPEISDLFPDELVDSEIREIPKGWEINPLGNVFLIQYGKNLPTKNLIEEGYPVFGGNGVIGFHSKYIYEEVMTLIACRGAASGKVGRSLPKSFVTNNSLVINHEGAELTSQRFIEFTLESGDPENYVTGSAQPQLTIDNIKNFPLITPPSEIVNSFQGIVNPLADRQLLLDNENQVLSELRDTLLPKLISGELRIPDAEKFLEEAGI